MKKILVACGTAIATSTVVAKKIEKLCKENGVACKVDQCKATEVVSKTKTFKPDVIVSTTTVPGDPGVPVLSGRAFLTGVNLKGVVDELMEILKK